MGAFLQFNKSKCSTKIGKDVMIGGQVGIVGHINIARGVKIAQLIELGAPSTKGLMVSNETFKIICNR